MLSQPPGADDVYYAPAQSAGPVPMLQWGSQGCSSYTSSGSGPTEVTGQPSPPCIALVMSSNLFPASSVSRLEWHSFLALPLLVLWAVEVESVLLGVLWPCFSGLREDKDRQVRRKPRLAWALLRVIWEKTEPPPAGLLAS